MSKAQEVDPAMAVMSQCHHLTGNILSRSDAAEWLRLFRDMLAYDNTVKAARSDWETGSAVNQVRPKSQ